MPDLSKYSTEELLRVRAQRRARTSLSPRDSQFVAPPAQSTAVPQQPTPRIPSIVGMPTPERQATIGAPKMGILEHLKAGAAGLVGGLVGADLRDVPFPESIIEKWASEYSTSPAQNVGQFVGEVGPYAIGAGAATKIGKLSTVEKVANKIPAIVKPLVKRIAHGTVTGAIGSGIQETTKAITGGKPDVLEPARQAGYFAAFEGALGGLGMLGRGIRKLAQAKWGKAGVEGGRKVVNPFGTPDVTLAGRNIVEPFHEAYNKTKEAEAKLWDAVTVILSQFKNKEELVAAVKNLDNPELTIGKSIPKTTVEIKVKQPWEMTSREYTLNPKVEAPESIWNVEKQKWEDAPTTIKSHEWHVGQAMTEGLPVPPEVMAEYPQYTLRKPTNILAGRMTEMGYFKNRSKQITKPVQAIESAAPATLSPAEILVRQYFDKMWNWVNKHRIARGEEPVPYRQGYITHAHDYSKDASRVFMDVGLPKSMRFPFMKRAGEGYPRQLEDALRTYTRAAIRDVYYGDALHKAVPEIEKLTQGKAVPIITKQGGKTFYNLMGARPLSERHYAEAFVQRQLGWPTPFSKVVQAVSGISPSTQRKIGQGATAMFYRSLIGAALDTSIKNLTQGVNTLAEYGVTPTLRGYAKLMTSAGRATLKQKRLLEEFEPLLSGGEAIGKMRHGITKAAGAFDDYVLAGPMRFAEYINRGATYHSAIDFYLKKGMSLEEAEKLAVEGVKKLQFAYGKTNISPYMQGVVTRPLYQFLTFPTKQAELMYRWATEDPEDKGKLFRYFATTGALLMGGKYADVDFSGIFIDPLKMIDPDSKDGWKLPGANKKVRFSLQKMATTGFVPQGPAPILSTPLKALAALKEPDVALSKKGLTQAGISLLPGGRYGKKVYDFTQEMQGVPQTGYRGRTTYKPTTKESVLKLAGLRGTQPEIERTTREDIAETEKLYQQKRIELIDILLDKNITADDKREKVRQTIQELKDENPALVQKLLESINAKTLQEEAKKKQMTTQQRFMQENKTRQIINAGNKERK